MGFTKRRVVTGHDSSGAPVFSSDGLPAGITRGSSGAEIVNMWFLGERPATVNGGGDEPAERTDFVPPQGGVAWRFMHLPPRGGEAAAPENDPRFDKNRPGFHATETIDFIDVVSGRIRLELDDHAVELQAGDCVIQRGTSHRWVVLGDEPCVFGAVMLAVGDGDDPGFLGASVGSTGPRRVVTEGAGVCADGPPATSSGSRGEGSNSGVVTTELWHTFAPVVNVLQGGDAPVSKMQLNPPGGGVTWKRITVPAAMSDAAALMHQTPTIDLVRIAEGTVNLELPGQPPVRLTEGDCVVQRGTEHAWRGTGDGPFTLSAVMIGVDEK